MTSTWQRAYWLGILVVVGSSCATAETLQFPEGVPVVQIANVAGRAQASRPAQLLDTAGSTLSASYDVNGRLTGLKVGSQRNVADIIANYRPDGRIGRVAFGNGYELRFEYDDDTGVEYITDRFGNTLVRTATGERAYVTTSSSDANGYLVATLRRVEALFTAIAPVDGLDAQPATTVVAP